MCKQVVCGILICINIINYVTKPLVLLDVVDPTETVHQKRPLPNGDRNENLYKSKLLEILEGHPQIVGPVEFIQTTHLLLILEVDPRLLVMDTEKEEGIIIDQKVSISVSVFKWPNVAR